MKFNMTVEEFLQSWSPQDGGYYPDEVYRLDEKKQLMLGWELTEEDLETDPFVKCCTDGYIMSFDGIESVTWIEWNGYVYFTNQFGEYCIRKAERYDSAA